MHRQKRINDASRWYMAELSSRVVAESGRPSDRSHLGKLILQSLKDAPDLIAQIDGATGESETNASILERSVRCAITFNKFGLKTGDVIVLMAPNYLDLTIPFIAALYLGIIIAPVDWTMTVAELKDTFSKDKPRIIFCEIEKAVEVLMALKDLELDAQIITLNAGHKFCSFSEFLEKNGDDSPIEEFKPTDFDPEETIAVLLPTSGTTGLPKSVATTHINLSTSAPYWWARFYNFPTPVTNALLVSPLQWITAITHYISGPIMRYTRIQSSRPINVELFYSIVNTYKPKYMIISPTLMTKIIKCGLQEHCDISCFENIYLGGSAVPTELISKLKEISPQTEVKDTYGISELTCFGFDFDNQPPKSCGKPSANFLYRLVDCETLKDIVEPNVPGELWFKGLSVFKEYYKNLEATEQAFTETGWFRTGDIFYRDENYNFYFVERFKSLLKYMNHQISPLELETVIRKHPGVLDVVVTGIPDPKGFGNLAVACVVRQPDYDVTADEIKNMVKESLTDSKQLRGGVIFLDAFPMTATAKINIRKLKEMALKVERQ